MNLTNQDFSETTPLYPELGRLTIDSRLADLPVHNCYTHLDALGRDAAAELNRQVSSPGIIIFDNLKVIGVISRRKFFENIGQPYGVEVYLGRPVRIMLDKVNTDALLLPADRTITDAAHMALNRPHDLVYEPIVVQIGDEYSLLDAYVLLLAQSHLLALSNALVQQQKEFSEILRSAGAALTSSLNINDILNTILHYLSSLIEHTHASVYLADNHHFQLKASEGQGMPETLFRDSSLLLTAHENVPKPIIIDDLFNRLNVPDSLHKADLHSWACLPLVASQEILGYITLAHPLPNFFREDKITSLSLFTNQAASAIQNARLYQTERKRAREMEALHSATSSLVSTIDLQILMDRILVAAVSAIPAAEKGSIHILDPETKKFEIRALYGYNTNKPENLDNQGYESRVSQVMRERKPMLISYPPQTDEHLEEEDQPDNSYNENWSSIVVPLIKEDTVIGALSLDTIQQNIFSDSDLQLLSIFGATATAAIQNAQLHAEVEQMAVTDPLTGLYNRRGFYRIAQREIERSLRYNRPLTIVMGDIDLFKKINDVYGHDTGDRVIQLIGEICRSPLRSSDVSCRFGGEEFVILLPETDLNSGIYVAERIRQAVASTLVPTDSSHVHISISLGVALLEPDLSLEDLLNRADQAMYASKVGGRNRVTVWSDLISISAKLYEAGQEQISERFADAFEQVSATLQEREAQFRLLENAHQLSQARLAAILQNAYEAIISVDAHNRIVVFNRGAEHTFGYTLSEVIGKPLDVILPEHLSETWKESLRNSKQADAEQYTAIENKELIAKRKDSSEIIVEARISKLFENGNTLFTIILTDITERKRTEEHVHQTHQELIYAYDETIEGWARALELRDFETSGHSKRVVEMTLRIALAMGISQEQIVHIRRGALLHDIGKMGIPDRILLKPGPLSDEEWEIMRRHPVYGYQMLHPITFLRPALDVVLHHHEKWDGSGYPDGLTGEAIPIAARIFAITDVWDALRSKRPYSSAWEEEIARQYILDQAGKHFDPHIVKIFFSILDNNYLPTLLSDNLPQSVITNLL